ncbi:MAG: RMD1 family protein [Planctomycetota bacterium]
MTELAPTKIPVTAVALDGRVDVDALCARIAWPILRRFPYGLQFRLDDGQELFVFRFGALVVIGAKQIDPAVSAALEGLTERKLQPESLDTYQLSVGTGARGPRVGWDEVAVPDDKPEFVAATALLLAQSSALERYEKASDTLVEEALTLSRELALTGRLPYGSRSLVQRVARLTRDRLELARWFYLVDRPEETWENPAVAELYDSLFANLELAQRHRAMLHKLESVEQASGSVLDIWTGRRANMLELWIVILIVVEIVLALAHVA